MYSMTMKYRPLPSSRPESKTWTMFGWIKRAAACASRWKRDTKAGSSARCSASSLTATWRSRRRSMARCTVDMPAEARAGPPAGTARRSVRCSFVFPPARAVAGRCFFGSRPADPFSRATCRCLRPARASRRRCRPSRLRCSSLAVAFSSRFFALALFRRLAFVGCFRRSASWCWSAVRAGGRGRGRRGLGDRLGADARRRPCAGFRCPGAGCRAARVDRGGQRVKSCSVFCRAASVAVQLPSPFRRPGRRLRCRSSAVRLRRPRSGPCRSCRRRSAARPRRPGAAARAAARPGGRAAPRRRRGAH